MDRQTTGTTPLCVIELHCWSGRFLEREEELGAVSKLGSLAGLLTSRKVTSRLRDGGGTLLLTRHAPPYPARPPTAPLSLTRPGLTLRGPACGLVPAWPGPDRTITPGEEPPVPPAHHALYFTRLGRLLTTRRCISQRASQLTLLVPGWRRRAQGAGTSPQCSAVQCSACALPGT